MTTWKENIRRLVINEGLWVDKELSSIGISDPKTFLIYSPVPWNQGNIERMLSVALQLRGHKVDEVICGGNFPACGMEHCNVPRPPCESCVKNAVSWFDVWHLKFKSTEDFRLQNDLTEAAEIVNRLNVKQYSDMNCKRMCELTFESLPIGKRIYEQIYWYFSGDVSNIAKVEEYLEKCAISYILTARITRRILERTKYDAVIACNGKTIEAGPLMDVVISSNIRVITWEEMFAFDNNKPVVEYNQDGVWDAIKHKPLIASERTIIENYFERWRKSEITPYKYYTDPITDKQQIMNTLGIREKSFKIVIFPNLINDSTSIGMHRAFDSMFDWVFSCVEYAIEHPDVDLIIRSHPAEKVKLGYWGSRIYVTDAVRNKYRNLSKNVIFVDAESQVSSYKLLELADIAMTYTGTLALEAPLYNKLCVVAGKSHLNFKGFTIDLQTKEQMYELFSGRTPIRRATEEEKQLAWQYGYFYRFRVTTKLDFYDKNATSFNIPTIKMLKKGGSIFWDNLCESIINNYAFIDLNQPDRKVVRLDKSISGSVAGNDVLSSRGNTKLWSKKLDSKLNQLPAVQARKINKYLREKSYLNKEIISRCYPAIWDFETTNRCGMQCTHCPRTYLMRRAPIDMDINLFKKIIDECRTYAQNLYPRSKIPVLSFFHYGEPALYRYFEESIKYSKSKGYHVIISSTSCAFNDKAIQAAVESQLDELWLIFDGMDDETFRKVRGKAASFTKGFAQLRKLFTYMLEKKSHLPEVKAVMIKHPFNRHQWREFNSFFSQNNIKHYLAHFSNFAGRVDKINELESLIADDPDEAKEIQRVSELNRHICYYPWHSVAVLADGRVVPCCRDVNGDCVLGDLNKESLADIWNGEKIRTLRAAFINGDYNNPLCSNCEEKSLETGVPNQIDRQAESLFMNLFAPTGEVHIRKKHDARKKKITITADQIITSSDPGGILFTKNNQILRAIIPPKERFYRSLLAEPQRKLLIDAGLIETEITAYYTDTYPLIVKHAQLPLITYPFEWVSENLKQSALFFCAFWKKLAALGFGLKDAHGYNIVYDYGNNPCFIDFCSIIPLQEAPLVCEEFNRYFLNPLYFLKVGQQSQMRHLVNLGGYETGKKRGGIDDQEVLPLLPSQLKKKYLYYREKEHFYRKEISSHSLVELYEEEINEICVEIKETCWATYYDVSSQYPTNVRFGNLEPDEAWQPKQKFLYDLLSNHPGQTVLDIGCSAGWFSRLAAKLGKHVLAMDNDESALERVYRYARRENLTIHPIFCDFSKLNSLYPKRGTRNIKKRFKSDIVLALAVVHHLVFRENMTFGSIARLLHTVTKDTLVVEFIDNNDLSIKDIMMKEKKVPWYTGDNFKLELGKYFKKINIVDSTGNFARYLLVCTGKIPKPDNVSEIINTTAEDNNRLLDSQTKDKMEKSALSPISRQFGFDRGKPIDRYYIENFLNENKHFIRGRVLEIGDNSYTKKYGSAVTQSDILNTVPSPNATIVGDLSTGENIPESAFDCIIMTQTIQCIYDIKSALKNMINALKPGGTLLITASGISQISRYDMDRWGEYWRFTDKSLRMLLAEFVPEESIHVEAHGNVAVAKAFLDGQAMHELDREVLDYNDNDYQVLLTTRVCKTSPNTTIDLISGKGTKTTGTLKTPLILLYHRVANDPIDSQLLAVSPENFEAHLKELAENYTVLPLHQLLEEAGKGQLQPDTLAITLDDGYLDNLTNAVPLLEKYGLHATIFVVSGMVGSQSEFWWDALERIFLTGHPLPELLSIQDSQGILEWGLTTAQDRLKAYDELCGMLRMLPSANIDEIVNQLLTWVGLMHTGRTTHRVVNAQQLKLLASSASVEIGSHSITHTRLSALSPQQQQYEIAESKQQLESIIEKPVRLFSYPYGNLEDITKETGRILAQTVYDAGIANVQGSLVSPVDMYAVPRRLVRNWSGPTFVQWLRDEDKGGLEAQTFSDRAQKIINSLLLPWSKQKQTIQPQNEACLNNYSLVTPPGVLL